MRPAIRPSAVRWTRRLPTRNRASATEASGSERRVRCVMRGSVRACAPAAVADSAPMRTRNRAGVVVLGALGVAGVTAFAAATPAPTAASAPAAAPAAELPDWLFPVDPNVAHPPQPPPPPPDDKEPLTLPHSKETFTA